MKPGVKLLIFGPLAVTALIILLSVSGAITKRFTYLNNYRKGYNQFLEGDYRKSSESFRKASNAYPEFMQIKPLLAASYYYQQDYTEADRLFTGITSDSGKTGSILCDYQRFLKSGKADAGVKAGVAGKLKALNNTDPNILANIAALSYSKSLSNEEIQTYTNMINDLVFGKDNVQHQSLALAYDTIGCLSFLKGDDSKAFDSFASAELFSIQESDIRHLRKNSLSAKLNMLGMPGNDIKTADAVPILDLLTGDELFNAQMLLCSGFLKEKNTRKARELLSTVKPASPKQEIRKNRFEIDLLRRETGGSDAEFKRLRILEIIDKTLELHAGMDMEYQKAEPSRAFLHLVTGYLFVEGKHKEFEKTLFKAISLFPDDPGFLRDLGIHLFNKGERKKGLSYMKKSLGLEYNQPELISIVADLEARYFITGLRLDVNTPFSRENPLLIVTFGKNNLQQPPEVRSFKVQGRNLQSIVMGNSINAVLTKRLSSGSDSLSASLELLNPETGETASYNVTSENDIVPPAIVVHSPSENTEVKIGKLKLDFEVSDTHSGIDFSSLDVMLLNEKTIGSKRPFLVPVIRNGIYRAEKEKRGNRVSDSRIICQPQIPITGTYILEISVRDLKGNKAVNSGIRIIINP